MSEKVTTDNVDLLLKHVPAEERYVTVAAPSAASEEERRSDLETFLDPRRLPGSAPRAVGEGRWSRASHGLAPRGESRHVARLRRAPGVYPRRRHSAGRLAALGAHRSVVSQGVRSGHEHELQCPARRVRLDAVRQRAGDEARLRQLPCRLRYLPARGQRDRVGLVTFDNDLVEYVPPSGRHLLVLHAITARRRSGRASSKCRSGSCRSTSAAGACCS